MSELMRTSITVNIELHAICLMLIVLLFINMWHSFDRNGRRKGLSLSAVYIGSQVMLISDCTWTVISSAGYAGSALGYFINIAYYIGSSTAAFSWFVYCAKELEPRFSENRFARTVLSIPFIAVTVLYLLSPAFGFIFSIEEGMYIRGDMFFVDPLIKMGYIVAASAVAIVQGNKKKIGYLRKRDFNFALFGLPSVACGVLQIITGVDFNCLGVTCGLVLIYIVGISNKDNENTDAIYSLANSFDAAYIVNMDTGRIRPLSKDRMHSREMPGMKSRDYTTRFQNVLSRILIPEDRETTLETFDIDNLAKRFEIDNSFSIRYRVKESSGLTAMHMAFFVRALGDTGKDEFLLGISVIQTESLLYERNEGLSHDNQIEEINTSIIESVAKIVEARDGGSGEHIVRVKRLTEILAREIMVEHPEYKLDEEKVKLISSASMLHDIGKIAIPDAILLKPGCLTEEEFVIMKTHSTKGCELLNNFPLGLDDAFLKYALGICRWHHEKYDGKGYPDGLKGEEIPIAAQIVAVVDCFDALTSDRPYKSAYDPETAIEMICNGECGTFSPAITSLIKKQRKKLIKFVKSSI